MLLISLACTEPLDSAKDTDSGVVDSDTGSEDTNTYCDPTIGSMPHPNFNSEPLPTGAALSPSELDPETDLEPTRAHMVFAPTSDVSTRLFVMLSDVGGQPDEHERILGVSTLGGQRSIGLAWPSSTDPAVSCAGDQACLEGFAQEALYGTDTSAFLNINAKNAITYRLLSVLKAMDAAAPGTGWSAYYSGDTVDYSLITVGGFGYGASLAAYLGKDQQLGGNVFFAGGCDTYTSTEGVVTPADWCSVVRLTGGDRSYGLLHSKDAYEAIAPIYSLFAMDLYGDFVSADANEPRYCTSTHMLTTALPDEQLGTEYHLSVAHDDYISVNDAGMPLLATDLWYMLTLADR